MANTLVAFVSKYADALIHLFYPTLCYGCGKPLVATEEVLCITCGSLLPDTGYHNEPNNETAQRFSGRVPFLQATSLAWFTTDGLLQHLIHGMKYGGRKDIARYLGYELGIRLKDTQWWHTVDVIVPVPLHPQKEASRGYNQSLLIAQGLSACTGTPVNSQALLRTRNTSTQTNKTRSERVTNMENAFSVVSEGMALHLHVLLIDDVLTTGATLEACAHALRAAGIIKISIATIGIAVS